MADNSFDVFPEEIMKIIFRSVDIIGTNNFIFSHKIKHIILFDILIHKKKIRARIMILSYIPVLKYYDVGMINLSKFFPG